MGGAVALQAVIQGGAILDAAIIMLDYLFEGGEPAVVHEGAADAHILERGGFEDSGLARVQAVGEGVWGQGKGGCGVARGAPCPALIWWVEVKRTAAVFLRGEIGQIDAQIAVRAGGAEHAGIACVPFTAGGDHGALKLGQGLLDAGFGDGGAAKGKDEQVWVIGRGVHLGDEGRNATGRVVPAHFDDILDRLGGLKLDTRCALVPEHGAGAIKSDVAQAHGMGVCEGRARNAGAEPAGIAKAIGLAVAGCAGNGVIHADAAIIEEDPAKAGRPIGDGIIGWDVIVRRDGAIIIGWQCRAGEIVQGVEVEGGELSNAGWRGDGPIGHNRDAG